jgi:hypothetical protein
MLTPVAPFDHVTTPPSQPDAVNVALPPKHIVSLLLAITGALGFVTTISLLASALQSPTLHTAT